MNLILALRYRSCGKIAWAGKHIWSLLPLAMGSTKGFFDIEYLQGISKRTDAPLNPQ